MFNLRKILVVVLALTLVFSTLMVQAFADYEEASGGESRPICGREETDGHTHTEACICLGGELICSEREEVSSNGAANHVHTEDCYCKGEEYNCGRCV